jgi:hypothetical protein
MVGERLLEEAWQGLPAVALGTIVRAKINAIDAGSGGREHQLKPAVDVSNIVFGEPSERNTTLIGNHDQPQPCALHGSNGFNYAW